MSATKYGRFETPLGSACAIVDSAARLKTLWLGDFKAPDEAELDDDAVAHVKSQLDEYFAGTRTEFEIEVAPDGPEFHQKVWRELLEIPFGETRSYGDLARKLGDPRLARAVGAANGANPIWLVVPCHRVIGSNGSLTGYAGGLHVKQALLEHEGSLKPNLQASLFDA